MNLRNRIVVVIAGTALLAGVSLGGFELFSWLKHRPERLTTYLGVALGDSKPVILYKKGSPASVQDDKPSHLPQNYNPFEHLYSVDTNANGTGGLPKGKDVPDYNYWSYDYSSDYKKMKELSVGFDQQSGQVDEIECTAENTNAKFCDLPFGIGMETTEQVVRDRLGTPQYESLRNGTKTMFYEHFNLRLDLRREQVTNITITRSPRDLHPFM